MSSSLASWSAMIFRMACLQTAAIRAPPQRRTLSLSSAPLTSPCRVCHATPWHSSLEAPLPIKWCPSGPLMPESVAVHPVPPGGSPTPDNDSPVASLDGGQRPLVVEGSDAREDDAGPEGLPQEVSGPGLSPGDGDGQGSTSPGQSPRGEDDAGVSPRLLVQAMCRKEATAAKLQDKISALQEELHQAYAVWHSGHLLCGGGRRRRRRRRRKGEGV